MCGICGLAAVDRDATPLSEPQLRRMTDAIEHRGPDDEGLFVDAGVALGMRRLSIIDLQTGAQPISNEDGSIWTVFNGEIFNFAELRADLLRRGHTLRTSGDTEVIVHLYEQYGLDFAAHLRGMFAIAVWDARHGRLVLVRDRMGVKPLHIHVGPRGLAFASEVKSLLAGGIAEPRLDEISADLFMVHGFVPGPRTLFADVAKLMPGHVLVWEDGRIVSDEPYWKIPSTERPAHDSRTWEHDKHELLGLLSEAVRARMVSDVPIGVMLSGGLDSSLIAALMTRHATGPVRTFSIGFAEDGGSDELADARHVAESLGTEHHELRTSAVDHPDLLDTALWHMEDPVADVSGLGFLLLCRLARETVTVALAGQGADELLGGYRKHQFASAAGLIHRSRALTAGTSLASRALPSASGAGRALAALALRDPRERLLVMSRIMLDDDREHLYEPRMRRADAEREVRNAMRHLATPVSGASPLRQVLFMDSGLALVDNMLHYFDRMSMATSLEVRVPFMDHDVVEYCMGLPDSRRVLRLARKELLKRAARGLVDDAIIDKPKRGFFHSALQAWLRVNRDSVVAPNLMDGRARDRGMFRSDAVAQLVGRAGTSGKKEAQVLLSILLLEMWQRTWSDADSRGRKLWREGVGERGLTVS